MPGILNKQTIQARHRAMLQLQQELSPFIPTIQELAQAWGVSKSTAHHTVLRLVTLGLVQARARGGYHQYVAVESTDPPSIYQLHLARKQYADILAEWNRRKGQAGLGWWVIGLLSVAGIVALGLHLFG